MYRCIYALLLSVVLAGCAVTPRGERPPGEQGCDAFFIYVLCVADLDRNGSVDYMFFDDTLEIFMYHEPMLTELRDVLPLHPCAIPMNETVRDYSSQLLYAELSLAQRLGVQGKLITEYRASQAAVDACYADLQNTTPQGDPADDPFLDDEDWDVDWEEGSL